MTESNVRELKARVAALEAATSPAVIPADAPSWLTRTRAACRGLQEIWQDVGSSSALGRDDIRRSDLALARRVDQLQDREGELASGFDALLARLEALERSSATSAAPDARVAAELRTDVLRWVRRWREHDAEVEAWTMESLFRDPGEGD